MRKNVRICIQSILIYTLWIFFNVVVIPIVYVYTIIHDCLSAAATQTRVKEIKISEPQNRFQNRFKNRMRTLSISDEETRPNGQSLSPLFALLPAELRLEVFALAICETRNIHMLGFDNKHLQNVGLVEYIPVVPYICFEGPTGQLSHETCHEQARRIQLPLLLTCRRV